MIDILLATYNGGKFLQKQLDSLFTQTIRDFHLLIRDDGSADNTLQIIEAYRQKFPEQITLITDDKKNVGATQNFGILLEHSKADYIFFCDQDDIWLPEKIEVSLNELQQLEQQHPGKPCMVYSDMKLINDEGELLSESEWSELHLDPQYFVFNRLLIQNIPHGCTMAINRPLRELVLPIPQQAMLHDHWIAIVASLFSASKAIIKPTMLLRFHEKNVTRKAYTFSEKVKRLVDNSLSDEEYEKMVERRVGQAKAIKDQFSAKLTPQQHHILDQLILLKETRGFQRMLIYIQNGFYRTTFRHSLKMILRG